MLDKGSDLPCENSRVKPVVGGVELGFSVGVALLDVERDVDIRVANVDTELKANLSRFAPQVSPLYPLLISRRIYRV